MNLAETESLLAEIAAGIGGAHVEVGITARPRYNDAYLKLTSLSDPQTHAIVSTNGAGTYDIAVTGGFSTGMADDQSIGYEDVREYVESYVRAAIAYLDGHWSIRKSKILRVPMLTIQKGGRRLNLASPGHGSFNSGPRF